MHAVLQATGDAIIAWRQTSRIPRLIPASSGNGKRVFKVVAGVKLAARSRR